ncbi:hypothetical protein [Saccharothrix sp. ST-888]|uniref:hypothetical protein n=1 Tax=Saccharothrix sp. ST-888 TaxID=1427391 RepID=UPI0006982D89|nr:hypothetical protein [Saccharothrix sp. ST-888]
MILSKSGSSKARRRLGRAALVCAAAAGALGLTATTAMADASVATFTLAQPDWQAGQSGAGANNLLTGLNFLDDGNLVLYGYDGETDYPLWASGTSGKGVTHLDWSKSGYVKLLDASDNVVCTLGKLNPAPGGHAEVQDDGNFVFYDTNGNATWSTGTYGHRRGNMNYCYT